MRDGMLTINELLRIGEGMLFRYLKNGRSSTMFDNGYWLSIGEHVLFVKARTFCNNEVVVRVSYNDKDRPVWWLVLNQDGEWKLEFFPPKKEYVLNEEEEAVNNFFEFVLDVENGFLKGTMMD